MYEGFFPPPPLERPLMRGGWTEWEAKGGRGGKGVSLCVMDEFLAGVEV